MADKRKQKQPRCVLFDIARVVVTFGNAVPHNGLGKPAYDVHDNCPPLGTVTRSNRPGNVVNGHGYYCNQFD